MPRPLKPIFNKTKDLTPIMLERWRAQVGIIAGGRLISSAGSAIGRISLAFAVINNPALSVFDLSILLVAQVIPQMAGVLVGGLLADGLSRKLILVVADGVAAFCWGGLWLVLSSDTPSVAVASSLACLSGVASVVSSPALVGIVPEVVDATHLAPANAVIRGASSVGLAIGIAAGGMSSSILGPSSGLLLNAISFLVAAILAMGIRVQGRLRSCGNEVSLQALLAGFEEVRLRPWILVMIVQCSVYVAAWNANVGVLGPMRAIEYLSGAESWAGCMLAQAVGGILGSLFAVKLRVRRPLMVASLTSLVGAAACLSLSVGASWPVLLCFFFAVGVATDVFGVLWETALQLSVPPERLSRVSSWDTFGSLALAPVGLGLAGPLSSHLGASMTLGLMSCVIALSVLLSVFQSDVRNFESTKP